jgi:hypothetical protein
VFLIEETGKISCQKNSFLLKFKDLLTSFLDNLSILERTIQTGSSSSNKYLYISISLFVGQIFESIKTTTIDIKGFLTSRYQEIRASNSSIISLETFANQYPGKSVNIYLSSTENKLANFVFHGFELVFTKSFLANKLFIIVDFQTFDLQTNITSFFCLRVLAKVISSKSSLFIETDFKKDTFLKFIYICLYTNYVL